MAQGLKPQSRGNSKKPSRATSLSARRAKAAREANEGETNSVATRWRIAGPLNPPPAYAYSDRIEQLLQRAAELAREANSAQTDGERRTVEALASMYEGTARSFAHLEAFRATVNEPLMSSVETHPQKQTNPDK
jgi:hypothetical protein